MPQIGFVKAMKDYFGLLPGQTVMQFKARTPRQQTLPEDKQEFASGLALHGHRLRLLPFRPRPLRNGHARFNPCRSVLLRSGGSFSGDHRR